MHPREIALQKQHKHRKQQNAPQGNSNTKTAKTQQCRQQKEGETKRNSKNSKKTVKTALDGYLCTNTVKKRSRPTFRMTLFRRSLSFIKLAFWRFLIANAARKLISLPASSLFLHLQIVVGFNPHYSSSSPIITL